MKKSLISVLLVCTLTFMTLLSGCGGGNKDSKQSGKDGINRIELTGDAAEMAELFGQDYVLERAKWEKENNPYNIPENLRGTTVKLATWIDHTTDDAKYAMANFEKDTGIKIEWVEIPQGGYFEKLASAVASGDAPDVFVDNNTEFPMILQIAKPLDTVSSINVNDPIWNSDVIKRTTFGNHFYEINTRNSLWDSANHLVYYNKKAFEENGILTPQDYIDKGEWTIDNMINIMREFKALGDTYAGGNITPRILAASMGSGICYLKNNRFVNGLNDEGLSVAYKAYLTTQEEGLSQGGSAAAMLKGTAGIYITDAYGLKKTGYFKGIADDVLGFAPVPTVDGKEAKYTSAAWRNYGILKGSKNPEGAGYFLRYFLDPYNYKLDDCFLNEEARDYYYKSATKIGNSEKVFSFDTSLVTLIGYPSDHNGLNTWNYTLMRTSKAQFVTTAARISNEVDTAVAKANAILDSLDK